MGPRRPRAVTLPESSFRRTPGSTLVPGVGAAEPGRRPLRSRAGEQARSRGGRGERPSPSAVEVADRTLNTRRAYGPRSHASVTRRRRDQSARSPASRGTRVTVTERAQRGSRAPPRQRPGVGTAETGNRPAPRVAPVPVTVTRPSRGLASSYQYMPVFGTAYSATARSGISLTAQPQGPRRRYVRKDGLLGDAAPERAGAARDVADGTRAGAGALRASRHRARGGRGGQRRTSGSW